MEPDRPNPDELLKRSTDEERKQTRGHLKVFFGASPGVGKTFAMLEAAQAQRQAGLDVVVGLVETHRRPETEALLVGLPILSRRSVTHRGLAVQEFDLDAALARRPALLLVDELAHSNAPGSRHRQRWQDVLELIDAGINVYTTVNVQHLDSLNDVVAQVTGVTVRETIPDSVLDQADEISLIDLPVEELRQRLEAGKVYLPDQAQRAMTGFFRPGNLIALRELALRRTADRVDAQMRSYRQEHSIHATWPVTERLIVCIGPSPFSAKLIRAAKRTAERLQAEWIVTFVETSQFSTMPPEVRSRVLSSLRLAEQLGAETVTLSGDRIADTLLRYARTRNVSKIIIGKHAGSRWSRLVRNSLLDDLIVASGDIEVCVISGEPGPPLTTAQPVAPAAPVPWLAYTQAALAVGASTLASLAFRDSLNPTNLLMFYLLAVVLVAMRSSRSVALFATVFSVAAFDFFCVPPYFTMAVDDWQYLVTFGVIVTVGAIISGLTGRTRSQAAYAVDREARTQALYRLTKEMAGETRAFDAARRATAISSEVFDAKVVVFLEDEPGKISFRRRTTDFLPVPQAEEGTAQWVFDHGQKAGRGMDTLPGATALYIPLKGAESVVGVMAVILPSNTGTPEQQHLLDNFASQTALAIERARATATAREAQLQVATEQVRNGLLSAVSHDLRTPLASITGAATTLLSQRDHLAPETQNELLESIAQEAERLSRLVNNLLEMTRLESGAVAVHRDWHPLEEIVGAALRRLGSQLGDRRVVIDLPADLPLVSVDDVLIEQLFLNLFENAAKYTPPGSLIQLRARPDQAGLSIEVSDTGPGFAPGDEKLVWGKFYRGKSTEARGAGLGLAICHAIIIAHGGTVKADNLPTGGAVIRIWLPLGGQPPQVPPSA